MTQKDLEAQVQSLKATVQYLRDFHEIDQVMHKYAHYLLRTDLQGIVDLFAQKDPNVSVEIADSGVFKGLEGVKRIYLDQHWRIHSIPGFMGSVLMHNPWIEIHPNGKEARGMWTSLNLNAKPSGGYTGGGGALQSVLGHGKYANTLVKEDGKWKLRNFHWYVIFRSPLDEGWVKHPISGGNVMPDPKVWADEPSTFYMPYNPDIYNRFDPPPPEPYE